ncbi:ATP-binding protein [Acetoanaerobium noterae]|uniref:ATP-binding protein n=1 Tax=Acetoanaerobium noterae TaxID=745369 RepID=UPI0009A607E9|nr:ATP-binding protein [Acetoanaerobium noterae]
MKYVIFLVLATALSLEACTKGKRIKFYTASELANILLEKHQERSLNTFMRTLNKLDLLVIEETGFVPLHKDASELLFQVISDSYEKRSLIITSNLEFGNWNIVFGNNRLTAVLVDRLVHHAHIFVFSGESYRLRESMKRQQKRT